MNGDYIKYYKN